MEVGGGGHDWRDANWKTTGGVQIKDEGRRRGPCEVDHKQVV